MFGPFQEKITLVSVDVHVNVAGADPLFKVSLHSDVKLGIGLTITLTVSVLGHPPPLSPITV